MAALLSCQSRSEKLYNQAYEKINEGQYLEAVRLLEDSSELEKNNIRKTKALFEAARLLRFEIQDYNKALLYYRKIILSSEDARMRLSSQEAVTEIYFENLQDYETALRELLVLEPLEVDSKRKDLVKLRIAQSYQLMGNFEASMEYIEASLKNPSTQKNAFLKLKAQIFLAQKKYDESLKAYQEILASDEFYFEKENLYVAISMVYEEKEDYKTALEYLEKHKDKISDQNYYELRYKRLKERQINKPFSKGMRK